MAGKIDRFTQPARQVLQLANDEAERFEHNYIGTEHVLIGLVREEEGLGGQVLRSEGVTVEQVSEIVTHSAPASATQTLSRRDLTPRTKQVLEYAVEEARKLNHSYIGTEHLLLGLIRQGDGLAIDVLRQLGLTSDRIRRDVMQILVVEDERKPRPAAEEWPSAVQGNVRYIYAILASDSDDMIDELARYAEFLMWKASRKDKPK